MSEIIISSTDLLSNPSRLKGAARIFDITGKLDFYDYKENADEESIARDWKIVGLEINYGIKEESEPRETSSI